MDCDASLLPVIYFILRKWIHCAEKDVLLFSPESFFFSSNNLKTFVKIYPARALRALGLLLADGTPTVGGGKTF